MNGIAAYDELDISEVPDTCFPDRVPREPVAPAEAVIISDIHLGSANCQAKALVAFLHTILEGEIRTRRLIINGDVFDSIDFRRLKKNHWKVLSQIRHLSDKLEVIWIAGNHDGSAEIISHLLGVEVVEEYVLASGSRKYLVIHGHQFDEFINDHPILTWLADCGYWLLQKLDRTHYIARMAKHRSKTFVRCAGKIREGAGELAAGRNCDGAICGHTHHAVADAQSAPRYFNSGCWTESPGTYLVVQNERVELKSYAEISVGFL
jgi:UDP-2,3-diacylglucosamine pyrophosphatase LpxH